MRIHLASLPVFLFLFLSCRDHLQKKTTVFTPPVQKIIVTRNQVYDLSGYAAHGGGNPFGLFDENALVDPRYEKYPDAFIPVTNCQPTIHPGIYFNKSAGSRILIDLKISYNLKEIYLYDRSGSADSCRIYTGDLKKWKKIAAFNSVSRPDSWGWKKISLDENSRFVMIQFSSYETAITEMVLYGIPNGDIPAAENFSVQKGFTHTTLDHFLGVNYIMEKEPRFIRPFHYSRIYNVALDFDNDTTRDEQQVQFNMLHYGYFNKEKNKYIFDIDTLQHINDGNIWFSIRGVSRWMSDLGLTDKDRPVNSLLMNPENPSSYSRHAAMLWNMAAFFGNQQVDTQLMSISNTPKISGRGSMHIYENGNEEDAPWVGDAYCSPVEYFAQSTADWDGDEGRIGKHLGIHSADSGAQLMMSGLVDLDTNRVKTYQLLSENLRNDRQFIWQGGIQYHYYAQRKGKGISPEEDSLRRKLTLVADCSYRIAPGVKCFLGENGYDKAPGSRQAVPRIPGLSAPESQGILLLRSINACFFSGFDAYILYWLRDGNPWDDPRTFLTSGILRGMPDGKTMVYPAWYYISTMVNRLGKFLPDKIIRESGDAWIYSYRNEMHPDSVAYFIYKPTVNGTSLENFTVETGKTAENRVLALDFTGDTDQGKEKWVPVADGKIRISVKEKPVIILCKELPPGK